MLNQTADSPRSIIQRVDWQNLVKAHSLVKACQVVPGIQQYKRLLLNQFVRYFYDNRWGYSDDPSEMSLNWACVYLAEYYMRECVWADWVELYRRILPESYQFSPLCRSRLMSIAGWAQLAYSRSGLVAHHFTLIGIIYRRQNRPQDGEEMLRRAIQHFSVETDPFYAINARDYLAGLYAAYQNEIPDYAEKAEQLYQEIQAIGQQYGDGTDTEAQHYNQGWYYLEKANLNRDDMVQALAQFEQGEQSMQQHGLIFEQSLNRYGKASAYFYLKEYERAILNANAALAVFWSNGSDLLPTLFSRRPVSVMYTAMCLKLLATIYEEKKQFALALDYALRALKWHDHFDVPIQRRHLYHSLSRLYTQLGQADEAATWAEKAGV
jgi:tetratricopeptide (TPR) repeat protein